MPADKATGTLNLKCILELKQLANKELMTGNPLNYWPEFNFNVLIYSLHFLPAAAFQYLLCPLVFHYLI